MLAVVASVTWRPILLFRAFTPIVPLLCLLFGWAFTDGLQRRARLVAALFAVPILLGALVAYYIHVPGQKGRPEEWTGAMDWRAGDVIYHVNEGSYMALHFYTPPERPQYLMPRTWRNLGALSDTTRDAMGFQVADLESVSWRRAWCMVTVGPTTARAEDAAIRDLLARYPHRLIRIEEYPVSTFALYLLYNPVYAR